MALLLGDALYFGGILFFAKISEQIKHMSHKKRKELLFFFLGGTGLVIIFRLIFKWSFFSFLISAATVIIYLLYARTYIPSVNILMSKYIGNNEYLNN